MSDQPNDTGPSHETLANLNSMMPSFINGLKKKKIVGKGKPALVRRPRKVCKVCGLLHDHAMLSPSEEIEIHPTLCDTCGPMLESGYAALVCGEQYAMIKCPRMEDWAGRIKQVSPQTMGAIEKEFGSSKLKSNGIKREAKPTEQA